MNTMIRNMAMVLVMCLASFAQAEDKLVQHLQDISVTVKSPGLYGESQGSGVIVTRELKISEDGNETEIVNFVWTAAHVVDNLRTVRTVIENGQQKRIIEFKDAQIVQELMEKGRKVGEIKMDAKVIRYSDSEDGEDLCLLMVRKRNFVTASAKFYLEGDKIVPIGTELFHVGSLLGQVGSNSMTRGIMSKVGRVLNLGSSGGIVFDQTTVTAFPGSSGGGVYFSDRNEEHAGKYVGMLVRGAGEGFNFIVPVRRMSEWAESVKVQWALDDSVAAPSIEELLEQPIEDASFTPKEEKEENNKSLGIKFMIVERIYRQYQDQDQNQDTSIVPYLKRQD